MSLNALELNSDLWPTSGDQSNKQETTLEARTLMAVSDRTEVVLVPQACIQAFQEGCSHA